MANAIRDVIVFGIALVASAVFLFVIVPVAIIMPSRAMQLGLSPRFLPSVLGYAIALMAAIGLTRAVMQYRRARAEIAATSGPGDQLTTLIHGELWPLAALAVLIATYYVMPFLGMTLSGALCIAALLMLGWERRLWVYAVTALAFPFALDQLFSLVLHVPLPVGTLFR